MRRTALLGGLSLLAMLAWAGSAPAWEDTHQGPVIYGSKAVRAKALHGNKAALNRLVARETDCAGADDLHASAAVQERAMSCLLGYARDQAGLSRLGESRKLDGSADSKAGDILRCNEFSHEACGRDFLYWIKRSGYLNSRCWWAGENLAWGTGNLGTPRSIFRAWLNSPSHRANILGGEYDQFGLSLRVGGLSGNPDAHVWVNHFGRHC